jgi:serine/threonine protein kinase
MAQLGKYDILEEIGRGGFGVVYKARDLSLERVVALKVLHPQLTVDPRFIENFHREARNLARINHPNVVTVHEIGEEDGRLFIAMEYLPGGSLEDRLKRQGTFTIDEALKIIKAAGAGLTAGHKRDIIHRDIKPGNILFNEDGQAVIGDFGVAWVVQLSCLGTTTQSSGTVGTPFYRPPELWRGSPPPSPATDVYSLACVLYEMLTGEVLFSGDTPDQVMYKHFQPLRNIDRHLEKFPSSIHNSIITALLKNPDERYSSPSEFQSGLVIIPVDQSSEVISKAVSPLKAHENKQFDDTLSQKGAEFEIGLRKNNVEVSKKHTKEITLKEDSSTPIVKTFVADKIEYVNVRKVVNFILSSIAGIVVSHLVCDVGLYHNHVYLLMFTSVILGITLMMEPKEVYVPELSARKENTSIIIQDVIIYTIYVAIFMAAGTVLVSYFSYINSSRLIFYQSLTATTLTMFQISNLLNCRSRFKSLFQNGVFTNPYLFTVIITYIVLVLVVLYMPFMQSLFNTHPLRIVDLGLIVLVASSFFGFDELWKYYKRKTTRTSTRKIASK